MSHFEEMWTFFEAGYIGGEPAWQGVPMLEFPGEREGVSCSVRDVARDVNTQHVKGTPTAVS